MGYFYAIVRTLHYIRAVFRMLKIFECIFTDLISIEDVALINVGLSFAEFNLFCYEIYTSWIAKLTEQVSKMKNYLLLKIFICIELRIH